jgi:hypothetical protein
MSTVQLHSDRLSNLTLTPEHNDSWYGGTQTRWPERFLYKVW